MLEYAAGMGQEAFSEKTAKEKWREHMRENPYKRLPPIERKPWSYVKKKYKLNVNFSPQ